LDGTHELLSRTPTVDYAKKETPPSGIIAIPSREVGGQDGAIRVNQDGVIVNYSSPSNGLFPYVDTSTVNSSGVGPDTLHTFTLPANSLASNGDYIDVWYAGAFSISNRDKAVQAEFGGTAYENSGVLDVDSSTGWVLASRIIRTSPTTVRTSHAIIYNALGVSPAAVATSFNLGGYVISRNSSFTVPNLVTNPTNMRVRSVVAAGAAAADVFQNQSMIEVKQARTVKLV
jgi:hypothetical protein